MLTPSRRTQFIVETLAEGLFQKTADAGDPVLAAQASSALLMLAEAAAAAAVETASTSLVNAADLAAFAQAAKEAVFRHGGTPGSVARMLRHCLSGYETGSIEILRRIDEVEAAEAGEQ